MSYFKDVVVCKFTGCSKVFNDPRILPCGKRTCAAHIEAMVVNSKDNISAHGQMIKCHFCGEIHSFPENGKGFPVDENISLLLQMKHCKEHEAAKKCFNEVTQLIDKLAKIDQEGFVIDYFERVEADIMIDKELNLQKLVAHYQKLVDEVHERKVKCLHNLKANKTLENELAAIKQTLSEHEAQLKRENLDFIIKILEGDEDKWKAIQSECTALLEKVKALEEELKEKVIGDQMTEFKPSTNNTQVEDICGKLDRLDRKIDSTIISTDKLKNDLVTLCKLSGKQFKLLYRASRDGFQASAFHAKCDHQAKTLTIINANGCIFGGYTSVTWDSIGIYKPDPSAFLFSLINAFSAPQLMPVKIDGYHSIYCCASYGPTFGVGDLYISNNSNATASSSSCLNKSYNFQSTAYYGSTQVQSFLTGCFNFKTSEIEVFILN